MIRRRAFVLGLPAIAAGGTASRSFAGEELLDVLRRPAAASARAEQCASLTIARAGNRLVTAGERGIVLLSDDHASTWRQARVPASVSLTALYFVDARRGWMVGHGGIVLASADGGESWTRQLDGVEAARIARDAAQADIGRSGAAASETAHKALSDAERLVADGPDKPFLDVFFWDADHGMAVGAYGLAFKTDDGGQRWQSLMGRLPNPRGRHLYRIAVNGQRIFIVGEQGLVLRSDDGAETFAAVDTPYTGTYFGAVVQGGTGLLAFGLRGHAYRSADGVGHWERIELRTQQSLVDCVRLLDDSLLLVDQQGRLFRSPGAVGAASFEVMDANFAVPVTGLTQAADGSLVASSLLGPRRLAAPPPKATNQPSRGTS